MSSAVAMSAAEHVCTPLIICSGHAWCPGLSCHCWKPCTLSGSFHGITHTPNTFTNWQWILTGATHIMHKNQNTLHISKSAMVQADHPSLIWHTYGISNTSTTGSTTGMNKDMPLILKNNHTVGVTYEVTEINWFYKQIYKHPQFVKHVNLYHEKGRPNNHRTGSIR